MGWLTGLVSVAVVALHGAGAAHVAVVGAGYSGLTAALEMTRLGHSVVVYDRLPSVGGRAQVVEVSETLPGGVVLASCVADNLLPVACSPVFFQENGLHP